MQKEVQRDISDIFKGHRVETIFKTILHTVVANNFSVAFWRNPFLNEFNCLVNFTPAPDWRIPDIENLEPGFIFSPFENNDNQSVIFLSADLHIKWFQGDKWQVSTGLKIRNRTGIDDFFNGITARISEPYEKNPGYFMDSDLDANPGKKSQYMDILDRSIKAIKSGRFNKVVPSRVKSVRFRKDINPASIFLNVSRTYPNSFISLVSTPASGTWLGASPEILIAIDHHHNFRTTSVAGTKTFKSRIRLSDVSWTQKEIEEQAMVSRYIINCFKRIRLREFDEEGPKTVRAGNLLHLKTLFSVNMKDTNFPQLGSVMLKLLHPTSAVCGMPKEEAKSFLHKVENYNRKFYSGYLGPVNINDNTQLYVNIRCANILHRKVLFYAGAGVTADSIPSREWKETEAKIQSIARFFKR